MGLQHVVITSVDRDDLPNCGAEAFAELHHARSSAGCPRRSVEVLVPDFKGTEQALRIVLEARPDISITTPRPPSGCTSWPGPAAATTARSSSCATRGAWRRTCLTKTGIILGMGEEWDEVLVVHARSSRGATSTS